MLFELAPHARSGSRGVLASALGAFNLALGADFFGLGLR